MRLPSACLMVLGLALPAATLTVMPAAAQGRPDSLTMTCRSAQAFIASRGAAVIGTGPHIYDRFVASRQFCQVTEETVPAWIRTRDSAACYVGFTCRESSYDDFFD